MKIRFLRIVLIVLFLFSISCSLMLNAVSESRDGIYLMPKGYTGEVVILFGQPDGVVPEVEDGLFVYKIPKDGVLKVKTKGYTGIVNLQYFYVDGDGQREPIKSLRITGDRDVNGKPKDKFDGQINQDEYENGIFIMNAGGIATTNSGGKIFSYTSFIVGAPKDNDQLYEKMQKRISNIHRQFLVENTR